MQRFFVIVILTVAIVGVMLYFAPKPYEQAITSIAPDNAQINVYCRGGSVCGVDLGFGSMVRCSVADLSATYSRCGTVDGISATFEGDLTAVERILSHLRVRSVTVSNFCDVTVISGYSGGVRGGVILDGKRVNCQIAYRDGVISVGFPLILGDY